jgi:hypothetical protein
MKPIQWHRTCAYMWRSCSRHGPGDCTMTGGSSTSVALDTASDATFGPAALATAAGGCEPHPRNGLGSSAFLQGVALERDRRRPAIASSRIGRSGPSSRQASGLHKCRPAMRRPKACQQYSTAGADRQPTRKHCTSPPSAIGLPIKRPALAG